MLIYHMYLHIYYIYMGTGQGALSPMLPTTVPFGILHIPMDQPWFKVFSHSLASIISL